MIGGVDDDARAIAPFLACGDLAGFDADQARVGQMQSAMATQKINEYLQSSCSFTRSSIRYVFTIFKMKRAKNAVLTPYFMRLFYFASDIGHQSYPLELGDDGDDDGNCDIDAFAEFAAFNRSAACVPVTAAAASSSILSASSSPSSSSSSRGACTLPSQPSESSAPSASASASASRTSAKYEHIAPLQPPRNAPYSQFLHLKRGNMLGKQ
jgi:hypothetical protein